jgi:formylmethanofuran dehydrogenase subunit C
MRVSLEFSLPGREPVDLDGILPETVLALSKAAIEHLPVLLSGKRAALGDACRVRFSSRGADELHLLGEVTWLEHIGHRMSSGLLVIEGDGGCGVGEGMSGGTIDIQGSAGDCLGLALHGGSIHIAGNAGDWCGAAVPGCREGMTGGMILIKGNAGRELGAGMRRGFICVAGDVGDDCASRMLAGTILCAGHAGKHAAAGMRRGSLVASKIEGILPGFRPAGEADIGWLRLYLRRLAGMGVSLPGEWERMNPNRYTGDHLEMGKGEILVYDAPE